MVVPAFDQHHRPERALVDECVHCGFCLPSCPTYLLWGEEMDSPRGRIHLVGQALDGAPLTSTMVEHFDRCLGCLACVTACPSGVRYDRLIETVRGQVERRHRRPLAERALRRAVFALFPYRRRLRLLAGPLRTYQRLGLARLARHSGLLDRLPAPLAAMERLLPQVPEAHRLPGHLPAVGRRRAVVGLLVGCVQSVFFPEVNAATARLLAAEGCDVVIPPDQGCCGALSRHAGRDAQARRLARRTVDVFERGGVDAVVVDAAGCGSAMKDYAELLADDPRYAARAAALAGQVRDLSELLVELGPVAPRRPLALSVAYHDACHLAHAQNVRAAPRQLLAGVPELQVGEVDEPDICCGSAGVYNLLQPEAGAALGRRKAGHVLRSGADVVVTANPGCAMQIAAAAGELGRGVTVVHIAQVLDASLRGLEPAALTGAGPSCP